MAEVSIKSLVKAYNEKRVIDRVSFDVAEGEFCILLGPSGCGKSTILRLIAGLAHQDAGQIVIGGRDVSGLDPKDRDIAMVFQSYALYPHLTARENMAFPLKMKKMPRQEIEKRVQEAANLLNIGDLLERKPKELSGGQRQRVAIGRAIVRSPQVFLFDEPLSNLDAKLRSTMRVELARLHQELQTTTIYVTHDQIEAMTLGQKIILLDNGVIQQIGPPQDLYCKPANLFVASFIGIPPINLVEGEIDIKQDTPYFTCGNFSFSLSPRKDLYRYAECPVTAGIRPEALTPGEGPLRGTLEHIEHIGAESIIYVRAETILLTAKAPADFSGRAGDRLTLAVNTAGVHLFRNSTRIAPES